MGFFGFFLKRISNRIRPALELEPIDDKCSSKKTSQLFPITHWLGDASRSNRNQTLRKSWAWNSTYCHWGTGIPCNNKRAHARVVSNLLIISLQKLPVFNGEIQSECFQCFPFRSIANVFITMAI